jgi:RHH-type proline utilization regulon transcriptional repressor/proline dehydrogenase/delta 1-pyrroline-5-carboxylate dehydrogenase
MDAYLALLENGEVNTISVKVSSICAQLNVLAFEASLDRVCDHLEELYRKAMVMGGEQPKMVMLDMEAYRDLELTHRAFVRVLSKPEFKQLSAGIVLQAYLPDSHGVHEELLAWARVRTDEGGAPIQMRIVKGANLAVERVESSISGWAVPIFDSKEEVDASFKEMLERSLTHESLGSVRLGVASHNLLDVAFSLILLHAREIEEGAHFEVLAGMAGSLSRTLRALDCEVLLYSPAVAAKHLHSAVAYLVRRLDENTAEENYLRHSFGMRFGDEAWESQRAGFLESRLLQESLELQPRRKARDPSGRIPRDPGEGFENEPDTDFILPAHRIWVEGHLKTVHEEEPPHLALSIGGERVVRDPVDGFDPGRPGHVPYRLSLATAQDVEAAIECGVAAAGEWATRDVGERAALICAAGDALRASRGMLIATLVMDGGKSVEDADSEVSEAIDFAEYYAATAVALQETERVQVTPRGLTVVTPPWNFPLAIPLGGVFAALATGNTVVLKPARETACIATRAVELCHAAGIPAEVLQLVVAEDDIATEFITNPAVKTVVLTGGTETARLFRKLRPSLHLLAETGGKNPSIVSRFADRDLAVYSVVESAFGHAGQKCSATSLLIITRELAEDSQFIAQLVDAAKSMHVGNGWDLDAHVTPLIHPPQGALERALTQLDPGEEWWLQPQVDPDNPRLWSPGIKAGVLPGSWSHQTEFFGPVLSVMVAGNLQEALSWANATSYGLTAGIHTLDETEQAAFIHGMDAGNLYVNRTTTGAIVRRQPFGGRKASCFGPGAKAGGPNYVGQFVDMADEAWGAKRSLPRKLEGYVSTLEQFLGLETGLREAASSYQTAAEGHFLQVADPSNIRGQDNLFRYQFHARVLLMAFPGATTVELARAALAMRTLGLPFEICMGERNSEVDERLLDDVFDVGPLRGGSWKSALVSDQFQRVRAIGEVSAEALALGAIWASVVDDSPVLHCGRRELVKYVLEQSVSVDFHRHGHLGLRELDE